MPLVAVLTEGSKLKYDTSALTIIRPESINQSNWIDIKNRVKDSPGCLIEFDEF